MSYATDPVLLRAYIEGGKGRLTLVSQRTGSRILMSFAGPKRQDKPMQAKDKLNRAVFVREGWSFADSVYLGVLWVMRWHGVSPTGTWDWRPKVAEASVTASQAVFQYMVDHLDRGDPVWPPGLVVEPDDRCCRCGKALTDPESRRLGIGPDCLARLQAPPPVPGGA